MHPYPNLKKSLHVLLNAKIERTSEQKDAIKRT